MAELITNEAPSFSEEEWAEVERLAQEYKRELGRVIFLGDPPKPRGAMLWLPFERGKPQILRQSVPGEPFSGLAELIITGKRS